MAFGLIVNRPDGTTVFSSERPYGGSCVGTFALATTGTPGTVTTWTFNGTGGKPDIGLSTVRAIQIGMGAHSWTTSGNTVTFTERTLNGATYGHSSTLMVFAI
jgi:hypothetical protein